MNKKVISLRKSFDYRQILFNGLPVPDEVFSEMLSYLKVKNMPSIMLACRAFHQGVQNPTGHHWKFYLKDDFPEYKIKVEKGKDIDYKKHYIIAKKRKEARFIDRLNKGLGIEGSDFKNINEITSLLPGLNPIQLTIFGLNAEGFGYKTKAEKALKILKENLSKMQYELKIDHSSKTSVLKQYASIILADLMKEEVYFWMNLLSKALIENGDEKIASEIINKLLIKRKEEPLLNYLLELFKYNKDKGEKAVFKVMCHLSIIEDHESLIGFSLALFESGENKEAMKIVRSLIRRKKYDIAAYIGLALVHLYKEEEALEITMSFMGVDKYRNLFNKQALDLLKNEKVQKLSMAILSQVYSNP